VTHDVNAVLSLAATPMPCRVRVLPTNAQEVDGDVLELLRALRLRPLGCRRNWHGLSAVSISRDAAFIHVASELAFVLNSTRGRAAGRGDQWGEDLKLGNRWRPGSGELLALAGASLASASTCNVFAAADGRAAAVATSGADLKLGDRGGGQCGGVAGENLELQPPQDRASRGLGRRGRAAARAELDGVRQVEVAIRYFRARLERMDYVGARRHGLPIGSGNVEATCKSLVTVRMKRPGAQWKHTTGDEVLQLRALQLSDRWAPAVQRAIRPLAKPVQIVGVVSVRAAANTNRNFAPSTRGHERGPPRSRRRTSGAGGANGSETIGAVSPRHGSTSQYENHTPMRLSDLQPRPRPCGLRQMVIFIRDVARCWTDLWIGCGRQPGVPKQPTPMV
jgi:hypothetical protein